MFLKGKARTTEVQQLVTERLLNGEKMNIEFRHGPRDGERRFLPVGKLSETIIIEVDYVDHLYRRTDRRTNDGYVIYQYISILSELTAA